MPGGWFFFVVVVVELASAWVFLSRRENVMKAQPELKLDFIFLICVFSLPFAFAAKKWVAVIF